MQRKTIVYGTDCISLRYTLLSESGQDNVAVNCTGLHLQSDLGRCLGIVLASCVLWDSPVRIKGLLKVCLTDCIKAEIFHHRSEITSSRVAVDALFWHHCASEQIQGKRGHSLPLQMVCYSVVKLCLRNDVRLSFI